MGGNNGHSVHHISPLNTYLKVAGALIVLTVLTVFTAKFINLGAMAGIVAFAIATVKASLVLLFFMHLKDEGYVNRVIFGAGFFFLFILILFSALDIWTRVPEVSPL